MAHIRPLTSQEPQISAKQTTRSRLRQAADRPPGGL